MKKLLVTLALGLSACSTTMISTWKKPGTGELNFKKVAVIAPVKDQSARRTIEDRLVEELKPTPAIPTYTLMPPEGIDRSVLAQKLLELGCDGAISVRIVKVDKEAQFVPGTPYYGFGGWPYYDPGYMTVDTYVRVETSIYSVRDQELLFSATSETINPNSLDGLIDQTVKAVRNELEKQGMIGKGKPVAQTE